MIDERGRGGHIAADIENVCTQKLVATILETAVEDRAYLETVKADTHKFYSDIHIDISELDFFAQSDWCKFLMEHINLAIVDVRAARLRGVARAQNTTGRRPERIFVYNGEERTASGWACVLGVTPKYVRNRWEKYGRYGDREWLALGRSGTVRFFEWNDKTMTIAEIAKQEGLRPEQIRFRVSAGMDIADAVNRAKAKKAKDEAKRR